MIVKFALPIHPSADDLTATVALTALGFEFVAIKPGMLPEPFAPRPIVVLSFVQLNVAPLTGLLKVTPFTKF